MNIPAVRLAAAPRVMLAPRFGVADPKQSPMPGNAAPGLQKPSLIRALMFPAFLMTFLGTLYYQGSLASSPIGKATGRVGQAGTAASVVASGQLGKEEFLENTRQQAIAGYFRSTMREISQYNDNVLYKAVEQLLPQAGLTDEEVAFSRQLLEDIKKGQQDGVKADYKTFAQWLDQVAGKRLAPETLNTLKAESQRFWNESAAVRKKMLIANVAPLMVFMLLFLINGIDAQRRAAQQQRQD